ncbi:undecaprenyl-phosphate glucose phosphotransferase [Flavobacterium sp. 14A]|uniref:undecaprenyl-phosphate glucose phosphotransferase n=1 Tax=Flavobacterium sp. 14A TaxID=2735896 RepID=UPI00157108B5|nr:undecaprenyl-phosphate glucose phosphotransferase [Flavobacterium sp. 14A]
MTVLKQLASLRLSRYFKLVFVLWDLAVLNAAIILSFLLCYGALVRTDLKEVKTILLMSNLLWIIILLSRDAYRIIRVERIETILYRMLKHIFIHLALIAIFIAVLNYNDISRVRMLYFYLCFGVMLFISRLGFMKMLKDIRAQGYNFKSVIVVGANEAGENIKRILSKDLTYGYKVLGFFDDKQPYKQSLVEEMLGDFNEIGNYVLKQKVDEMYIAISADQVQTIKKLTALCERNMIRIKFIPEFHQYTKSRKVEITFYDNTPVLMFRKEPLEGTINRLSKKVFDIGFSLVVILGIFPWLFPLLCLLIKLDSPGPVFFKQQRSGRENDSFTCYKFRTMQVNKDSDSLQATKGDARVTRMGAFMRKTNFDELPQFFNVLWGTMSVIGPRPHMLKHTESYSELINNYQVRHYTKPGISGWAQVNGYRGETKELIDMKNRVDYDIWYIENWSLILDIKIIYHTVANMFKGEESAY